MDHTDNVNPPWGALPVEQYIILSNQPLTHSHQHLTILTKTRQRKWDPSSPLSVSEQRARLVSDYIQADALPAEMLSDPPTRVPTAEEVRTILEPWRAPKLRRIAERLLACGGRPADFLFLRTHYAGGAADDAKLRAWLDADPPAGLDLAREDEWWTVLDDAALFGHLGDDWIGVYEILPELAAPTPERAFTEDMVQSAREIVDLSHDPDDVYDEDYEEAIQKEAWGYSTFRGSL
ncbi:hypothetical protein MFIFM68171_07963 [Madurella fahalii]|uniref:Uncharacterized protein n=1 Tax=Madurella fahalii TaxID=1157608 RepID=A0ABQ0GIZ8_9PEZI